MNYKVTHTTTYKYGEAVGLCYNIARLVPRNTETQVCNSTGINIHPQPDIINEYEDFFGNKLIYFAIQHEHRSLKVTVSSEVEKKDNRPMNFYDSIPWEQAREQLVENNAELLDIRQYIPETTVTKADEAINEYTLRSFTPGKPMFDAVYDLMLRIHENFTFKPGFTTIATPSITVFREQKGVCQDFAHLAIACLRSIGLPARYVSGYIETLPPDGQEKLVGVDASHAWFSVFIPGIGWVDFDPTNNQIPSKAYCVLPYYFLYLYPATHAG